jgi:hypothetical protein
VHELVGHAAEQPFAQTKMTVSSHDDDVGFSAFGFCDQRGSDVAVAASRSRQLSPYSLRRPTKCARLRFATDGLLLPRPWQILHTAAALRADRLWVELHEFEKLTIGCSIGWGWLMCAIPS